MKWNSVSKISFVPLIQKFLLSACRRITRFLNLHNKWKHKFCCYYKYQLTFKLIIQFFQLLQIFSHIFYLAIIFISHTLYIVVLFFFAFYSRRLNQYWMQSLGKQHQTRSPRKERIRPLRIDGWLRACAQPISERSTEN